MRILVGKCASWDHVYSITATGSIGHHGFGTYWNFLIVFKASSGHGSLILLLLERGHGLVLFNPSEIIFVGDTAGWIDSSLGLSLMLSKIVNIAGAHSSLNTKYLIKIEFLTV